jgi:hypothetical protein
MMLKALPSRTKAATDDNGNSTDPADWQAGLLGIATEFAKVAASNLKTPETRQQEVQASFNWKPWAIGGGAIVGGLILLKVLKVF